MGHGEGCEGGMGGKEVREGWGGGECMARVYM